MKNTAEQILVEIANDLMGISYNDMTHFEKQAARKLWEYGYLKLAGPMDDQYYERRERVEEPTFPQS